MLLEGFGRFFYAWQKAVVGLVMGVVKMNT